MKKTDEKVPSGYRVVFSRFMTTKSGRKIYRKNGGVFRFLVKIR